MHVRWFGQSAFSLVDAGMTIFIDPFGSMDALSARGLRWAYPRIDGVSADVLLVTHEHGDHNGVDAIAGSPRVIRSTAGTFESALGTVCAIASEHDQQAGTQRGPNTIFVFTFAGLRVCHFGDFGQAALRPEQRRAIGDIDLLFLPVGGAATIDGDAAARLVRELQPRYTVPMHYRTPAISFLEPEDRFLAALAEATVVRLPEPVLDTAALAPAGAPLIVVPAPPLT